MVMILSWESVLLVGHEGCLEEPRTGEEPSEELFSVAVSGGGEDSGRGDDVMGLVAGL